ncbi:MAG: molybdopterin-dependent oxidoreductase [Chloroflexi bacterium]|nr:molybdopterin-dependent oxidoreductase [Chloroflexota bacterium]
MSSITNMTDQVSRRKFLSMVGASTTGAVLFVACSSIPDEEFIIQAPVELPEDLVKGRDNWFATTCGVCDGGEGVVVRVMEGRAKKIAGNPDYPINLGKQNVRCDSALQMLYHPDRIAQPMARSSKGSGFTPITWGEAEAKLQEWAGSGRVTVATNPIRGQLGKVAGDFAAKFNGKHIQFQALEQGVLHGAMKSVFGADRLPEFDLGNARTVASFGADFLGTWISPTRYSTKYGEFRNAATGSGRGQLFQIEPRMSITAAAADKWIPNRPGMEGELALAVAAVIVEEGLVSDDNIARFTANLPEGALDVFKASTISLRAGVSEATIHDLARSLATEGPSLVIGGGSAGAHTNGSFNLNAIYSLNILLGSVGAKGGVFLNPDSPIDGLPSTATGASFADWEAELAQWRAGNINTVIIRGANIAHGLPRSVNVQQALDNVPHVVAFADVLDDTSAMADLVLPEASYLETWGIEVPEPAPGYQTVGFQQPVSTPARTRDGSSVLSDGRGFGDVLLRAADGALGAKTMKEFVDDAADTLQSNGGGSVTAPTASLLMRGLLQRGGWWDTNARGQTRPKDAPALTNLHADPEFSEPTEGEGEVFNLMPFASQALLDGRVAPAPWLQAVSDPITTAAWTTWVEINHHTAKRLGISQGDKLIIKSTTGEIEALAYPHRAVPPDMLGVPIGQGHEQGGRWAEGRGSNVLSILVDKKDAETGALAWAATKVRIINTGLNTEIAKAEGTVEAIAVEPGVPILVVEPGGNAKETLHHLEESYDPYADPNDN